MASPPALLLEILATSPSSAASTGVPRGAMMSSALCLRLVPRASLKLSCNCEARTPCTGTVKVRAESGSVAASGADERAGPWTGRSTGTSGRTPLLACSRSATLQSSRKRCEGRSMLHGKPPTASGRSDEAVPSRQPYPAAEVGFPAILEFRTPRSGAAMSNHVYKTLELTGSSSTGIEDAVNTAIAKAAETVRNMQWFKVTETRGHI